MKKLNILLISLLCLAMAGCGEDEKEKPICDCSNKKNVIDITNLKGTVYYNEDIQKWYIAVYTENSYDEVRLFLPCNIEDIFKISSKKVLFSGATFNLTSNITAPAGSSYVCIEITSMSNL